MAAESGTGPLIFFTKSLIITLFVRRSPSLTIKDIGRTLGLSLKLLHFTQFCLIGPVRPWRENGVFLRVENVSKTSRASGTTRLSGVGFDVRGGGEVHALDRRKTQGGASHPDQGADRCCTADQGRGHRNRGKAR
jgi:hypothetical protein